MQMTSFIALLLFCRSMAIWKEEIAWSLDCWFVHLFYIWKTGAGKSVKRSNVNIGLIFQVIACGWQYWCWTTFQKYCLNVIILLWAFN